MCTETSCIRGTGGGTGLSSRGQKMVVYRHRAYTYIRRLRARIIPGGARNRGGRDPKRCAHGTMIGFDHFIFEVEF